jgi:hypothetical protein
MSGRYKLAAHDLNLHFLKEVKHDQKENREGSK